MSKRNRTIDFWKFVYSVIIMIQHSGELREDISPLAGGSIGVEFFFIVSGYLMVASFERQEKFEGIAQDTLCFIKRKSTSLFPAVWAGGIIGVIVTNIIARSTIKGWIKSIADNIWSFLLIDFSGIRGKPVNGVTWYLSAMLLIMLAIYPIMHKNKDLFLTVIAPIITLFSLGFLYQNYGNPRNPTQWIGFSYKGLIRGFGEICLGAVCFAAAKKLRERRLTYVGHTFFSLVENICYFIVLFAACTMKATRYDYILILLFAIAICCSFSEQTVEYSFLGRKTMGVLSHFGFCLYLGHVYWARSLDSLFPALSNGALIAVYVVCSIGTAGLVHFLSKQIQKVMQIGIAALFASNC